MADNDFEGQDLHAPESHATGGFSPENTHPEYNKRLPQWEATRDVYLGAEGILSDTVTYVPRRSVGESQEAYDERISLLHISGLLGAMIDAVVGMFTRKAPEADTWGSLGAVDEDGNLDENSLAAQIVKDVDRQKTTIDNFRRQLATWMLVYFKCYIYVDTNGSGEGTKAAEQASGVRPFATLVTPIDVPDWITTNAVKTDVFVRESVDKRTSLTDGEGEITQQALRLTLTGWERWELDKDDKAKMIDSGDYKYVDATGRPRIPLVEVSLPLPRYFSYNLARIVLAIINHDSHLDTLGRAGALGQFLTIQGDEEDVRKNVSLGDKMLPYPIGADAPSFVGHDMDAAGPLQERIRQLTSIFWTAAMYEFTDRPTEKTATEIEQEWASGVGAFLTLLAGSVEQADNEIKGLLAQAAKPGATDFGATKFSREYKIEDVVAELTKLRDMLFGVDPLPMTPQLKAAISRYILERLDKQIGLLKASDINVEEELDEAVAREELDSSRLVGIESEIEAEGGFDDEAA